MPSLVLFGHRTPVAGDDLRLLCGLYIGLRLAQIGLAVAVLVLIRDEIRKINEGLLEISCEDEQGNLIEDVQYTPLERELVPIAWIYVLSTIILAVCYIATDVTVWKLSDQGTPTQSKKRKGIAPLCSTRLICMGTIRLAIFVTGVLIVSTIEDYCSCRIEYVDSMPSRRFLDDSSQREIIKGCKEEHKLFRIFMVLIISQLVEVLLPLAAAVFVCLREGRRKTKLATERAGYTQESRWRICCACCCNLTSLFTCCLCGGKEVNTGGYVDVARALSTYFDDGGTLDLVTTDYIVGLVMLLRVQWQRRIECRKALIEASKGNTSEAGTTSRRLSEAAKNDGGIIERGDGQGRLGGRSKECIVYRLERDGSHLIYAANLRTVLSPQNDSDIFLLCEGAHFCRLALGIYGWMMHLIDHPVTSCCRLGCAWCKRPHFYCCKKGHEHVIGDGLMGCNEVALLEQAGIQASQVKYAQFAQGFEKTPYCITVDHEWKSVVITIRGTLSLDDAVADLTIRPVLLDIWAERFEFEDGKGEYCHSGILSIASWIYEDLKSHGILESLLVGGEAECSGYQLRVEGHSLGAGVSAAVAIMLRSEYPSLRCLAFSPPGCVFSRKIAAGCKDFVTSFVLGDDVVPRLGLMSMENLRHEVLALIARVKVPKHVALRPLKRNQDVIEANTRILHKSTADMPTTPFWEAVKEFEEVQSTKKIESGIPDITLYPPGRIIHLFRTSEDRRCLTLSCTMKKRPDDYVARYAEIDDLQEIIVSPNSLSDHQPINVCSELERVADSFGLKPPYAKPEAWGNEDEVVGRGDVEDSTGVAAESLGRGDFSPS